MFPKAENMLVLDSVDSTNNYAMAMIQQGLAKDGQAVFAMEQTNGRGRRGRQWNSNKGDNITLSLSKQMQWMPVSQQFQLSVAVALGCFDLVSKYVPGIVSVKWPNDIFINDTKAGGILIENTIKGTLWQWAVIGIGLNVNQSDFESADLNANATSLSVATKKTYDVLILAKELYVFVLNRINELKAGNFSNLLETYNQYLFGRGRIVKLKNLDEIFETKIIGVSDSGQLITWDKIEKKLNFDEVEFKGLV
jgi:BirA family transcriptional regulator, biotin operon repressor / biotin---[acetyl-CoA-carboxylase] ligase